jgi:hypothetical protein
MLDQLKHAGWFVESSSGCQRSPFGLQPKGSFMDVEVKHEVENPAQANLLIYSRNSLTFMEPKNYITMLGYH